MTDAITIYVSVSPHIYVSEGQKIWRKKYQLPQFPLIWDLFLFIAF